MARIGVSLDPFVQYLSFFEKELPALSKMLGILEMNNISQFSVSLESGEHGFTKQMIDVANKVTDKMLNVYVEYTDESIKNVLQLQVGMVTIAGGYGKTNFQQPINTKNYDDELRNLITEFSAHDIVTGICIDPNVDALRKVHRAGFEYVEISTLSYAAAMDYNDEMSELHKIREIANMASNLGMGVNLRGDIGEDNLPEIAKFDVIEDIILEDRFYKNAIFSGFAHTLKNFQSLLKD